MSTATPRTNEVFLPALTSSEARNQALPLSACSECPNTPLSRGRDSATVSLPDGETRGTTGSGPSAVVPNEIDAALLRDTQTYLRARAIGCVPPATSCEAWESFFKLCDPLVHRTVHTVGVRGTDTRDCMQEAWIEILRRLPSFCYDPNRGRFSGWICTLTRNRAIDFRRRLARNARQRTMGLEILASCPAPDGEAAGEQEAACQLVNSVLSLLQARVSPTNFRLLSLRWVEGRSVSEIAAELHLSPEQIRYRAYRLKKRLQPSFHRARRAWWISRKAHTR